MVARSAPFSGMLRCIHHYHFLNILRTPKARWGGKTTGALCFFFYMTKLTQSSYFTNNLVVLTSLVRTSVVNIGLLDVETMIPISVTLGRSWLPERCHYNSCFIYYDLLVNLFLKNTAGIASLKMWERH